MKFLYPEALWFLLVAPALVAGYVAMLRRKRKNVIRYASFGAIKEAMGPAQRFRRHIPPLLFLLAEVALIVACAASNEPPVPKCPSAISTMSRPTTLAGLSLDWVMMAQERLKWGVKYPNSTSPDPVQEDRSSSLFPNGGAKFAFLLVGDITALVCLQV